MSALRPGPETGRPMQMYWAAGLPTCWRPLLVLREKEVAECHTEQLIFDKKEHKAPHMLRLNPRGELPIFYHGNRLISESVAICDYLERIFPNRGIKLHPDDEAMFAKVCQRKHEALNLYRKGSEELVYWTWTASPEEMTQEVLRKKKDALASELEFWEKHLEKEAVVTYIAGLDFSMADVVLFPTLAFLVRMGLVLDERRFPRLRKYYAIVRMRPSVQATWPAHWGSGQVGQLLADV